MTTLQIGIVGYGDFGRFLCEHLAPYADIVVYDRAHTGMNEAAHGARFATVETVLTQPIVIPCIPSQFFEEFFREYGKCIQPNTLVVDVCSVKVKPLKVLQTYLSSGVQIIGTHPLFGPSSVESNEGIAGLKMAVSKVHATEQVYDATIQFFKRMGLHVYERTPEQHDRDMAYVQGLSHYIGRLMQLMDIPRSDLSTLAYDDLLDMKNIQGTDSWDLFKSIIDDNPYTDDVRTRLKESIVILDERLR